MVWIGEIVNFMFFTENLKITIRLYKVVVIASLDLSTANVFKYHTISKTFKSYLIAF